MKFNHINAMKDNDKPEAPEGYTVMLGQDLWGKIPPGMLCRAVGQKTWQPWSTDPQRTLGAYEWYAVPVAKDNDKPEAPEGYTVMLGKDVPSPVSEGTKYWDPVSGWNRSLYVNTPRVDMINHHLWYAVPNDPACTMIRDMAMKEKWNTDPKASQAIQKPQLQLIPPALNEETAKALMRGAEKYGFFNWRENKVEMMTYLGAMKRHIDCLIEGEDIDPDTGAHHLGCVAAGCGIVLDARKHGTLVDNRPPKRQID